MDTNSTPAISYQWPFKRTIRRGQAKKRDNESRDTRAGGRRGGERVRERGYGREGTGERVRERGYGREGTGERVRERVQSLASSRDEPFKSPVGPENLLFRYQYCWKKQLLFFSFNYKV